MKTIYVSYYSDVLDMEIPDIHHARTVFEEDDTPQPTGLYGPDGRKLFRVTKRDPIGFIRRDR